MFCKESKKQSKAKQNQNNSNNNNNNNNKTATKQQQQNNNKQTITIKKSDCDSAMKIDAFPLGERTFCDTGPSACKNLPNTTLPL